MLASALGLALAVVTPGRAAADRCLGATGTQSSPVSAALTAAVPVLPVPAAPRHRSGGP
jgi:hypothetical protein